MVGLLCSAAVLLAGVAKSDAALHITEFLASNDTTLNDEDGDASDWIELFNSGPGSASLDGYYLTDDPAALTKWQLPAETLAEDGFLVVFASDKDRRVAGSQLHTNFKLSSAGEYLALVDPDGSTIVAEFGSALEPFPERGQVKILDSIPLSSRRSLLCLATLSPILLTCADTLEAEPIESSAAIQASGTEVSSRIFQAISDFPSAPFAMFESSDQGTDPQHGRVSRTLTREADRPLRSA